MSLKFTEEYLEVGASFSLDVTQILYTGSSPFQKIQIYETLFFGKVLVIDNCIMLTEKDEFIYHEMIAHTALFVHPKPKKVLVIGGGDGCTVREVLKHQSVQQIDLVEIDRQVSEVCLKFMPDLSSGLLSEKVNCQFSDGVDYIKKTHERYDIIIIDSTDPINVGEGLFTSLFYQKCYDILKDEGILVNQAESPVFTPKWVEDISTKLNSIFPNVFFYSANIPTYPSGYWLFGFSSKKFHPIKDFQKKNYNSHKLSFKYYNKDVHHSAFTLPNYVKEIIEN